MRLLQIKTAHICIIVIFTLHLNAFLMSGYSPVD